MTNENQITTSQTFQEKMFERIRSQMGDLLSDQDLKAIVDKALEKAFFEKTTTYNDYGTASTTEPVIITLLRKEMEDQVKKVLQQWLDDNAELVKKTIDETIAKGMFGLVEEHLRRLTDQPLQMFAQNLQARGLLRG